MNSAPPIEPLNIDALFREHGAFIARSIERLVGPGEHVDDLVQEAFIIALQKRAQFDARRAAPSTWLYGVALNTCRRHLRSRRRFALFSDAYERHEARTPNPLPDEHAEREQALGLVAEVLAKLPVKQREVFALYEMEGLDGPQIAELVGVPVGTVWTRLHHARKAFTKHMQRRLGPEASA